MSPVAGPRDRHNPAQGVAQRGASIVLALGSNLGDRAATILSAVRAMAELDGIELRAVSRLYESEAVKLTGVDRGAPRYLNAVVTARYSGDPHPLLDALNAIESSYGRLRAERWGDRTLDIDIIVFDDRELTDARLTIPHPRAWERDFVLAPWLELDPEGVIPGRGRVADLLAATGNTAWPYDLRPHDAWPYDGTSAGAEGGSR